MAPKLDEILKKLKVRKSKRDLSEKRSEPEESDDTIYMYEQKKAGDSDTKTPYEPSISDEVTEVKTLPWDQVQVDTIQRKNSWATKSGKSPMSSKDCKNCNPTIVKSVRLVDDFPRDNEEDTVVRPLKPFIKPAHRVSEIVNLNCSFDE